MLSKRNLQLALGVLVIFMAISTLTIAFQSQQTQLIIDDNLTRHVDQYLLERSVKSIVSRELHSQNQWLWFSGGVLFVAGVALLYFRPKSNVPK